MPCIFEDGKHSYIPCTGDLEIHENDDDWDARLRYASPTTDSGRPIITASHHCQADLAGLVSAAKYRNEYRKSAAVARSDWAESSTVLIIESVSLGIKAIGSNAIHYMPIHFTTACQKLGHGEGECPWRRRSSEDMSACPSTRA
jgi:hypothetical protein